MRTRSPSKNVHPDNKSIYGRPGTRLVAICLASTLWAGCSDNPQEPEDQIRQSIQTAETAAARKDAGEVVRIISENYVDGRGLTRRSVANLMAYYLGRYQNVHLFSRIKEITFTDAENARVDLVVALAGQPINEASELANIRADLYRFNVRFVLEGSDAWRIVRADWQRASPLDFF